MPDVVGQNLDAAKALLHQLGLELGSTRDDSASASVAGTVVAQTPAAGAGVTPGTTVSLRVSARP
jgi:beta-lactam-binding protein with PASTA domain